MKTIDIVFNGPSEDAQFEEIERDGESVQLGEWVERQDGCWALRIPDYENVLPRELSHGKGSISAGCSYADVEDMLKSRLVLAQSEALRANRLEYELGVWRRALIGSSVEAQLAEEVRQLKEQNQKLEEEIASYRHRNGSPATHGFFANLRKRWGGR